ncbi:MAG: protoporphyrinogen oxidase [Paracoccaceae bacterium]|jgi:protoporphyrinogen oxidase
MTHDPAPASKVAVIGAGPAGLTAAYTLLHEGAGRFCPVVFEGGKQVGGISRTEIHNGYRFDIGGHRFFTKVPEVTQMWEDVLGDDFITVPRLSRIYYRGRFFNYPLKIFNALSNLGLYESTRIILSYLKWQFRPSPVEETFEHWVINRFGGRLYMHFFHSYTEKVWGIPPSQIRADWAAQRIKNLSLSSAVLNAVFKTGTATSLIEEFRYPRLGPGMMWEKTAGLVGAEGGEVLLEHSVIRINRDGLHVVSVDVVATNSGGKSDPKTIEAAHFVNTMALDAAILAFDPPPPPEVIEAAKCLKYRDFLVVTLVLNTPDPFPDNWIYVHAPEVKVGRIQNFRAWSKDLLPDQDTASIGMEYFCQKGDGLWSMNDADLRALAAKELEMTGLAKAENVIDAAIIRQPKAYPVYDGAYKAALDVIGDWLRQLENFQTVGRNGLHRYNNQDHSMLTAIYAARNIMGAAHDIWNVNVDRAYHEDFETDKTQ